MRQVLISLDESSFKIYKKLPSGERSSIVRAWLKSLEPETGKVKEGESLIKKLLTLKASKDNPDSRGETSRHAKQSYVMGNTTEKRLIISCEPYLNPANAILSSYHLPLECKTPVG